MSLGETFNAENLKEALDKACVLAAEFHNSSDGYRGFEVFMAAIVLLADVEVQTGQPDVKRALRHIGSLLPQVMEAMIHHDGLMASGEITENDPAEDRATKMNAIKRALH